MTAVFLASADVADIIRQLRSDHAAELAAKDAEIARLKTWIQEDDR